MILFANELILKERQALEEFNEIQRNEKTLSAKEMSRLQSIAKKYGSKEIDDSKKQVAQLLERVDIIPP